jgi:hypothetical protein
VATRRFNGLTDGLGDFVCLARGIADAPLAVADSHQRVERESPAAFYNLGDAVDRDDVLD